jgi:hypothetical protein
MAVLALLALSCALAQAKPLDLVFVLVVRFTSFVRTSRYRRFQLTLLTARRTIGDLQTSAIIATLLGPVTTKR